MKIRYRELFWIFFKIGTVLLGGGYVILPFLKAEFVEKLNLISENELAEYFALSQCTPGVIAVNVATFIGNKLRGKIGAFFAVIGVVLPSFLIIVFLAGMLLKFTDNSIVQNAFLGIRLAVLILIILTVKDLWRAGIKKKFEVTIFAFSLIALLIFNISPTIIIFSAALIGLIYGLLLNKNGEAQ